MFFIIEAALKKSNIKKLCLHLSLRVAIYRDEVEDAALACNLNWQIGLLRSVSLRSQ